VLDKNISKLVLNKLQISFNSQMIQYIETPLQADYIVERNNIIFTSMLENTFRHILQFNFDENKFIHSHKTE